MVNLPTVGNKIPEVRAPQSRVSAGAIAQPYYELSANLDKAGHELSKDVAEPLARQAGLQSVTRDDQGNVQVEHPPIVGDAAVVFARAAKVATVADFESTFQKDDADMRAEHRNDPQGYMGALDSYKQEKLAQYRKVAGPEAALAIGQIISNQGGQTYRGLLNEQQRLEVWRTSRAIDAGIETAKNDAYVLARQGGLDSPEYKAARLKILDLQNEKVKNPLFAYPQEAADAENRKLDSELRIAALTHSVVDQVYPEQGYDAAVKRAESILTDRGLNLPDSERRLLHGRVISDLNTKARDDKRVQSGLDGQIKNIEKVAAQGYSVAPDRLAAVETAVQNSRDPYLAQRLAAAKTTIDVVKSWRRMNPAQLEASLGELDKGMRENGASEQGIALKKTGEALLKTMRKEVEHDPLGWADRTGVMAVPRIDFGRDDVPAQMQDRIARAESVAAHYGTRPIYLRPDEQSALEVAATKGGEPMLQVAKMISDGFGDRAPRVLSEVAKDAPILAHVGALIGAGGSPYFVMDVTEAEKLARDKEFKLPKWLDHPSEKIIAAQGQRTREVFGDAFVGAPDSGRAAEAAAQKAYFARANRRGLDALLENRESKQTYDRSLQESAGARFTPDGTQYGGIGDYKTSFWSSANKVLVPGNIRADRFKDVIGALKDEDLKGAQLADGRRYTARDIQNARPVAVKGGYRFAAGDPAGEDPKWIRGADGKPFVLDLDQLEPVLRQRVPGAYAGGR